MAIAIIGRFVVEVVHNIGRKNLPILGKDLVVSTPDITVAMDQVNKVCSLGYDPFIYGGMVVVSFLPDGKVFKRVDQGQLAPRSVLHNPDECPIIFVRFPTPESSVCRFSDTWTNPEFKAHFEAMAASQMIADNRDGVEVGAGAQVGSPASALPRDPGDDCN